MKKTISIIYRLAFLIFGIWAIFENVSYNIRALFPSFQNFTVFSNVICIVCIAAVFFVSLKKSPYDWLIHIKGVCTLLAWLIFILNINVLLYSISTQWILRIFLPAMMIFDWLLFDKKGSLKLQDLFLWLAGLIALICGFLYVLSTIFGIDDLLTLAGFGNGLSQLLNYLPYILGIAFLMYLLDSLFSSKNRKNTSDLFRLLFRILFIIMEMFSFYILSGMSLTGFLSSLLHYPALVNFLCLLCISVLVIYKLFGSDKKTDSRFPRIKALFTIAILAVLLIQIFIIKDYKNLSIVNIIHNIIAPIMLVIDLLIFDYKKAYKVYDPFIWLSIPVLYSILNIAFKFSNTSYYSVIHLFGGFGILLVTGYIFFIIGKLK